MGSDTKVLLRVGKEQVAWFKDHHGRTIPVDAWIEVLGKVSVQELSKRLNGIVVEWSISTVVDQIWIECWERGAPRRELLFQEGRWETKRGEPLPFENKKELGSWLRKRRLLASPDGYEVLEAFLGGGHSLEGPVKAELLTDDVTPEAVADFPRVLAARQAAAEAERASMRALDRRRVLVLAGPRQVGRLSESGVAVRPGAWLPYEGKQTIEDLSHVVDGLVVELKFSGLHRSVTARAADHGRLVREVGYYDWQGWMARVGKYQPFEDERAMERLLSVNVPAGATPDVDAFFAAFLGKTEIHPSPVTLFGLTGEPRHRVW